MHAASRHGTPNSMSFPKDDEVSCEVRRGHQSGVEPHSTEVNFSYLRKLFKPLGHSGYNSYSQHDEKFIKKCITYSFTATDYTMPKLSLIKTRLSIDRDNLNC